MLKPRVYRDLITNVVFMGAPSTGKTTLVKALAEQFNTVWMHEYGRDRQPPIPFLTFIAKRRRGNLISCCS